MRKPMKKRTAAILLSLTLILSMWGTTALAAQSTLTDYQTALYTALKADTSIPDGALQFLEDKELAPVFKTATSIADAVTKVQAIFDTYNVTTNAKSVAVSIGADLSTSSSTGTASAGGDSGAPPTPGGSTPALPTSAADFTDTASIKNTDAVNLLISLGMINGVAQGNGYAYHPGSSITRAQMAKIIAVALAGNEKLTDTTTYTDCKGHWADTYIAFCAKAGAIDGNGDGTFQPDATVTGVQAAKMLLGTMGVSGLTGTTWSANTVTAANAKSLFSGISSNPSTTIDRDDAAQLIANALKASDGSSKLPKVVQISKTTTYPSLTIGKNTIFCAPAGSKLTMTVDGTDTAIAVGTYTNAVLNVTNGSFTWAMRMALYIKDGKVMNDYSATSAIAKGTYDGASAKDVVINSKTDQFNGIVVGGNSTYAIDNANISFEGNGGSDFQGIGAGIMATDTANLTIKNSTVVSKGAIRTAIWAGGESKVDVSNTVVTTYDADSTSQAYQNLKVNMMKQVPWALGLIGNCRATNVLGKAQVSYSDSIVVAQNWGALSTDSGQAPTSLTCTNVLSGVGSLEVAVTGKQYTATKTVNGVTYGFTMATLGKGSGYVTYADGAVKNTYNNCQFYAPDYIIISPANSSGGNVFNGGTFVSQRTGLMWHQSDAGSTASKGGTWTAADCMFLAKSTKGNDCFPVLSVDGATLNVNGTKNYSGVIYQLMDSDDAGGIFANAYTVPTQENNWSTDTAVTDKTTSAVAKFANMTLNGNIYNSVYTLNQGLDVTLDNVTLNGVISSSNANHVDENGTIIKGGTVITSEDYLYAGRIVNTASKPVNNSVKLTLSNGTTWNVTGTSYLATLVLGKGCTIKGTVTINGEVMTAERLGARTYTGDIVITPAS